MAKARLTDTFEQDLGAAMGKGKAAAPADSLSEELARRLAEAAGEERATTGRVMLYLQPDVYAAFKDWAKAHGLSMNKAATIAIETMMRHS